MPEITREAAIGGFVSVELAAKAAGIAQNEMQRIAAAFAKGREEPWFGTVLEVRTEKVMGRRHRDIRVSSLPASMRAALKSDAYRFLLAAEQVAPGAELRPQDFLLLHRAAHADFGAPRLVSDVVAMMCNGGSLLDVSRTLYDLAVDNLYGYGFRDDALPGVSADYRDWLDACRRRLGMSDRYFAALLVELVGVDRPERIDGRDFIILAHHLTKEGGPKSLPKRDYMDREAIGILSEARHQLGLSYDEFMGIVITIGGGVHSVRDLDTTGWCRVRAHFMKLGYRAPEPAPRVSGAAGFISQPRVNLLWRVAQNQERLTAAELASLTTAGADRLIDALLAPLIERRVAEVANGVTADRSR
ncbi:hypothetical protein [Methylobacterium brachiatum]|uniref:hypothetical protein n=1 Tax=Methylobacterium brachiatum TaxID=269660 RepID=UPI0008E21EB5|nr:hypothetical protein [Methylobacterium brachiatum]SFI18287.1 hypothetical protein SAMN02799642_01064 [Methylobacterium brachiatum]